MIMNEEHTQLFHRVFKSGLLKGSAILLLVASNYRREGWGLSALSQATGLSPSLLHASKKSLLKSHLIHEHYPERDKRMVRIYLTEEGYERANLLWESLRDLVGVESSWRNTSPPAPDNTVGP